MKQVICRLSDELHEELRRRSFEGKVSIAELIRRALKEKYQGKEEPRMSTLSEPSLMKIWDNAEDAAYDDL
jgi:hypothetical protein